MVQDHGFTEEQKQYLEGFITAIAKKRGLEMPTASASIPGAMHKSLSIHRVKSRKATRHIFM
jgi:hypothetical protein